MHFYPEFVNMLKEAQEHGISVSCLILYTKFEKMALERIVGKDRCNYMLSSIEKNTFMFC
jgi:hypothetical protein